MRKHEEGFAPQDAAEWFENRSYKHEAFSDLSELSRLKSESGQTVSLVLPSRNVADTVGGILDEVRALNESMPGGIPLVDQTLVVDADSEDGTAEVARRKGAEVFSENELLSSYGGAHGKGDAMWRSLSVATGDIVMFADADTRDFKPQFLYGTLGPMFTTPGVRFVKGAFRRPFKSNEAVEQDGGGRVTELTTKPLFNLFYPELTGFVQPLAGEFAADKELFASIPFLTGYAVETGIMVDVLKKVGLGAMAQVDLGTRQNRHQPLFDLGRMSYSVLRAVARRLRQDGRLQQVRDPGLPDSLFQFSEYVHAVATPEGLALREHVEELVERPPLAEVMSFG
ncbi:MAG: Glycosyltransferases involved in cell wall biogenesis [uncultured Rubrobacteraceae bacterium]|uniref:Glucosyl-3-phosphoglycerate synthase n=1 Tax=uncultured Rubrobacteraceae bacterium TaxID=349277 RepID=A0A6J4REE9_9ACTN|nr:MAG: Glycosyltransferases involved in cell wall biogenesis [uncultured Rubrobacteraceae bacterium]